MLTPLEVVRIVYLCALAIFVPSLWVAARGWSRLAAGERVFAGYLATDFAVGLTMVILAEHRINNHWLAYVVVPVESALVILALSHWQLETSAARRLRGVALLMLAFWIPPLLGIERTDGFSLYNSTIQAVIVLSLAGFTLMRRWLDQAPGTQEQPPLWIASGLLLYFSVYALITPLNRYLLSTGQNTGAVRALIVKALVQILAGVFYLYAYRLATRAPGPEAAEASLRRPAR